MKLLLRSIFASFTISLVVCQPLLAQEKNSSLEQMLAATQQPNNTPISTFRATRIISGHSIEHTPKGILDFRIAHRFSPMTDGFHSFFGLDGATIRLGLDYGFTNWLTVGIGRSSYQKEYDGFVKASLLRQSYTKKIPLSISYVGGISVTSLESSQLMGRQLMSPEKYPFSNRLFFVNQLLLAKKINHWLSLQITPSHIHYNLVNTRSEPNDLFALGSAAQFKISKRLSINVEHYYQLNQLSNTRNAFGIGCDIETGGHVFQLHFSNAAHLTERGFIVQTTDNWKDGGFRFGFNISRVFTIVQPEQMRDSKNNIW
jgi:hypothetical protein